MSRRESQCIALQREVFEKAMCIADNTYLKRAGGRKMKGR